jgi:hypothetical protein
LAVLKEWSPLAIKGLAKHGFATTFLVPLGEASSGPASADGQSTSIFLAVTAPGKGKGAREQQHRPAYKWP